MDNGYTDKDGKFREGNAGRPKGALNKTTRDVKYIIQQVLDNINDNDIVDIVNQLKQESPKELLSFIGKIAPKDLTIKGEFKPSGMAIEIKKLREQNGKDSINTTAD